MPDPAPSPQWEALQRREAIGLLTSATSCLDHVSAKLLVLALEGDGVFLVQAVPSENSLDTGRDPRGLY